MRRFSRLDFISQIAEPVRQLGLVDGRRKLLGIEEATLLKGAGRAVRSLGDIEDDGMGVELRRGVAVYRARRVVLELCSDEFAGGLGGIVAADPRLGVPLQFVQRGCDGGAVSLPHPIVAADQER